MNKEEISILVSSFDNSGPSKGAIAMANGLSKYFNEVKLIFFSKVSHDKLKINLLDNINLIFVEKRTNNFVKKIFILRDTIMDNSFVISFGFMADLVNVFFLKNKFSISSVRGNLSLNYYYDFNFLGKILAFFHYKIIKHSNYIFSMTSSMSEKIKKVTGRDSIIIRNFVDEITIKKFKVKKNSYNKNLKFIFVGTLSERKNIMFLIESFNELLINNPNISLSILGTGPLKSNIENFIKNKNLEKKINFIGYKNNPYYFINQSDIFVLPSFSEGISRAALEALFFDIPCVMFKVDGNDELIKDNFNGFLCNNISSFNVNMQKVINNLDKFKNNKMLPVEFTQENVCKIIIKFINEK